MPLGVNVMRSQVLYWAAQVQPFLTVLIYSSLMLR